MTHHEHSLFFRQWLDMARQAHGGSVSLSLLDPPYIMANPLKINNFPFRLQNVVLFGNAYSRNSRFAAPS